MKKFNQVGQKLSAAVAVGVFAASAFMLSACGGDSSDKDTSESAKRAMVKKYYNAELLSFEESKKELGFKTPDCFWEDDKNIRFRFMRDENGNIKVLTIAEVNGNLAPQDRLLSVDSLKNQKPECFN